MSELSEFEQRVITNIEEHGCFILSVFDPEGEHVNFAYSIGFEPTLGQPEMIISGLPSQTAKALINDTLVLCRDGFSLADFARTDRLLNGLDCVFRDVREERLVSDYFGSAIWYHKTQLDRPFVRAVQMVWPDREGLFPWDEGFDESFRGEQDELWATESVH